MKGSVAIKKVESPRGILQFTLFMILVFQFHQMDFFFEDLSVDSFLWVP